MGRSCLAKRRPGPFRRILASPEKMKVRTNYMTLCSISLSADFMVLEKRYKCYALIGPTLYCLELFRCSEIMIKGLSQVLGLVFYFSQQARHCPGHVVEDPLLILCGAVEDVAVLRKVDGLLEDAAEGGQGQVVAVGLGRIPAELLRFSKKCLRACLKLLLGFKIGTDKFLVPSVYTHGLRLSCFLSLCATTLLLLQIVTPGK